MAFLKDLKVNKISFVRRAANKRKFTLLKSDTIIDKYKHKHININRNNNQNNNQNNNNNQNQKSGGNFNMRSEVRAKLVAILKTDTKQSLTTDQVIETLIKQLDEDKIELEDAEVEDVKLFLNLRDDVISTFADSNSANANVANANPANTSDTSNDTSNNSNDANNVNKVNKMDTDINQYQEILKKQQDELESLKTQLAKSAEDQRRNELMQIFKSECTYAPVDVTKSVNQIIALEKIDKAAAETMLETFKSASAAVSESHLFGEYGTSTQGSSLDSYSDPFVSEIQKALSTVQKDDKTVKRSELVVDAIARVGGRAFQEYRNEHVRRIKRESGIL